MPLSVPSTQGFAHQQIGTVERRKRIGNHTHHAIANIPVGIAIVSGGIELLRKGSAPVGVGREIQVVRPGVAYLPRHLVIRPLPQHHGQRIVVRVSVILDLANVAEELIGAPWR